jgi:hypothetical protein
VAKEIITSSLKHQHLLHHFSHLVHTKMKKLHYLKTTFLQRLERRKVKKRLLTHYWQQITARCHELAHRNNFE